MAITVEELEIRIEVQKQQVLKDLEEVRKKLEETFAKAMPGLQQAAKQVAQTVQTMTPSLQAAAAQVKTAADSMVGDYGKVNHEIEKQIMLLENAKRMRAAAEASIRKSVPPGLSEKAQAQIEPQIQQQIASDPTVAKFDAEVTRISAGIDALKAKSEGLSAPFAQAAQQAGKVAENLGKAAPAMQATAAKTADTVKKSVEEAIPQVKKLDKEMQATAQRGKTVFEQLGATIARAFKFAVIYKGLRAMFDFIKEGIQNAINAPEIENMFRVAFGAGADEAAKFAEAMKKAYGISEMSSKQMLGSFQNVITSMGIGGQNAINMSENMTMLAYDISSLWNVDPQEAAQSLQSALTGQGRAVRKYGYVILESTIQETAYRLGIAKTGAVLTERQKVLAREATLIEQAKNAHGDFARTLGNVANQLRLLKDNIMDAGRAIGDAFIPFIQAVLPTLNTFFVLLQRIGNALATVTFSLFGKDYAKYKADQEQAIKDAQDMAQAEDEYSDSADKAAKAQKGLLSGFDKLNISKRKEGAGTGGDDNGYAVEAPDMPKGQSPFEKMADALQASLEKIKEMFQPFITNVGDSFKWLMDNVLVPLKDYTVNDLLPAFFEALAAVLNSPVWATVGEQIAKIYDEFLQPVAAWAGEKVVDLFKWIKDNGDLVAGAIVAIGTAFLTWKVLLALDRVAGIIVAIGGALKGLSFAKIGATVGGATVGGALAKALPGLTVLFTSLGTAISGALTAVAAFFGISVGWLVAIVAGVIAAVAGVIAAVAAIILNWDSIVIFFTETLPGWWNNTVIPFFESMWQGLLDGVDAAIEWVTGAWNDFMGFLEELPRNIGLIIGKVARVLVDFVTKTIPEWWKNIKEWFGKVVDTIKESFNDAIAAIKQWGADVWNFISVEIPKWVSSIAQWFSELPGKIWTWLVSAYEKVKQWGTDLINWAKVEIPKFVNSVVNFFKELPGKIWDVGVSIVTSLWDGIQSKVSWLWGMLKDFIDGFKEGFNEGGVDVDIKQKGNSKSLNTNSRMGVPHLASGGVLTSPRLVMGGEYPGAKSNPEIVTPQSLMYETSFKAQQAANQPVVALLRQLIEITKDGHVIEVNDYELGRTVQKFNINNNLLLGI